MSADVRQLKLALFICLVFFLSFVFNPFVIKGAGPDYGFHLAKSQNGCGVWSMTDSLLNEQMQSCKTYPPLFHMMASFFTARPEFFYIFAMFLLAFITPMLLFLITGRAIVAFFYFSATSYVYFIEPGVYPQMLMGILLLGLFATKNEVVKILILLLSVIAHSYGLLLIGTAYLLLLLKENAHLLGFLGCSPFWGNQGPPEILLTKVASLDKNFSPDFTTFNTLLSFFFKIMPFPFLIAGVKELQIRKRYDMLALAAILAVASLIQSSRILYFIPLMILPGVAWYCEKGKYRKHLIVLSMLYLIFQLWQWISVKNLC